MITVSIVLAVALLLFGRACMKWGFIVTMRGAGAIILCVPVFGFVAILLKGWLHEFGVTAPSLRAWLVIAPVLLFAARWLAGKFGWGNVLGYSFSLAVGFAALVLMLFLFLMMGVAIHATVPAMIFIAVLMVVLMGVSHKYQARGR